ncbi:ankyrin repeat domain-containing protein [Bdellovibrio bacteriovorus]
MNLFRLALIACMVFAGSVSSAAGSKKLVDDKAFELAYAGKTKELQKSVDAGININKPNEKGETLLMTAASSGQIDVVKFLLSKKADVTIKDKDQKTALYYALTNEQPEVSKALIEANAPLNDLNELGDNALTLASSLNDHATMKVLLAKDSTLVNKGNSEGKTPLMEAARHGNAETIKILLDAGADKKAKNSSGKTALDIATKAQNQKAVTLLSAKK